MKTLRSVTLVSVLTVLVAPVAFGGSSKIQTAFKSPDAGPAAFTKVAVAVLTPDADLRRRAEAGLARRIRHGAAASTLIPDGGKLDAAAFKERLTSAGFDGAIIVRPLPTETNETIEIGQQYLVGHPSLSNYWDSVWTTVYMPGYVNIEKIVSVEVVVYSVAGEKMLWAGRMTSEGPKSLRVFLDDLVKEGAAELKKQKVI